MKHVLVAVALSSLMLANAPASAETGVVAPTMDGEMPELNGDTINVYYCGGNAPDVTSCSNGEHTRNGFFLSHGISSWGDDYTGFIRSTLVHDGDDRVFTCEFNNGDFVSCAGSGSFPGFGADFEHTCQSFFNTPVNALDNLLMDAGIEGGMGDWECRLIVDE